VSETFGDQIIIVCFGYLLPHVVMVILYSMIAYKLWTRQVPGEQRDAQRQNVAQQTAKKVTRMILCVLLVFELCWLPLFVMRFMNPFSLSKHFHFIRNHYAVIVAVVTITAMSNGIFNAVLYATFNENFRRAFKSALQFERISICCRKFSNRVRQENNIPNTTG
jgi:hypothetical protein